MYIILCLFIVGVYITTNASTQVSGIDVNSRNIPDIMNYTTDINRYNLDLSGITSFGFEVKVCHNAHVLLSNSDVRNSSNPLYEIIIGYKDYYSLIIYRPYAMRDDGSWNFTLVETKNILNCNAFLPFWISWAGGDIEFGTGLVVGEHVVGSLTNTHHFEVRSIHVLTDREILGEWNLQVEGYFKISISFGFILNL